MARLGRFLGLTLNKTCSECDLRKLGFASRIVSIWNSLPNRAVSANVTNIFEHRHDRF